MENRNRDDYFNFDAFDESIDSRDYRRRQPDRRGAGYGSRPGYDRRRPNRRRNRTRMRNRAIIIG